MTIDRSARLLSRGAVAPGAAMNTGRRKFLVLGGAALALAGCGDLLGPPPSAPIYMLGINTPQAAAPAAKLPWSLTIMRPSAPASLNTDRIALVQPDATMDYYANADFPDTIPDLVQGAILQAFEATGALPGVAREADALHSDYDLVVDIQDFEMRYAVKDGVPEALVTLTLRLVTSHGRVMVGSTSISQRVPATANNVAAAAAALGQALGAATAGITAWALKFPAPPSQVPAPR
jgi:cholesterol transport system auxiliary component